MRCPVPICSSLQIRTCACISLSPHCVCWHQLYVWFYGRLCALHGDKVRPWEIETKQWITATKYRRCVCGGGGIGGECIWPKTNICGQWKCIDKWHGWLANFVFFHLGRSIDERRHHFSARCARLNSISILLRSSVHSIYEKRKSVTKWHLETNPSHNLMNWTAISQSDTYQTRRIE